MVINAPLFRRDPPATALPLSLQLSYFHDDVEEKIVALCKEAPDLSEL